MIDSDRDARRIQRDAIAERIQKKAHEMGRKVSHDEAYSITFAEIFNPQVEISDAEIEKIVRQWIPG